tara:strand:- start:240 stop:695 length:456 start_codon:yes stop_codon:yes gene_type:complete
MPVITTADFPLWMSGIQLDGSSKITTVMATQVIADHESDFAATIEDRGYNASVIDDTSHRLHRKARNFTGLRTCAQLLRSFNRNSDETADALDARADIIIDSIYEHTDRNAGADALETGDGTPGRANSNKTRRAAHTFTSTRDQINRTRKI